MVNIDDDTQDDKKVFSFFLVYQNTVLVTMFCYNQVGNSRIQHRSYLITNISNVISYLTLQLK